MAYSLTPAQFIEQYPFISVNEARIAARKGQGVFGAVQYGVERYQIRTLAADEQKALRTPKVARQACDSRKTTAKAICKRIFAKGVDRATFTELALARGIKLLTVNTLWNDIKAGRV